MDADCWHITKSSINGQVSQIVQRLQQFLSVTDTETNSACHTLMCRLTEIIGIIIKMDKLSKICAVLRNNTILHNIVWVLKFNLHESIINWNNLFNIETWVFFSIWIGKTGKLQLEIIGIYINSASNSLVYGLTLLRTSSMCSAAFHLWVAGCVVSCWRIYTFVLIIDTCAMLHTIAIVLFRDISVIHWLS